MGPALVVVAGVVLVAGCLQAAHERGAERADQDRVLAVGLLDPAPSGVSGDVEHRCERLTRPDREHLGADVRRDVVDQRRVPGRRQPDRLRELHRVAGAEPADRFFVDDRRDAEPGLVDEPALDLVVQLRQARWTQAGRRGDAGDLTGAVRHRLGRRSG